MDVRIGMVVNGCLVSAGPVPHGESRRWALLCSVCGYYFGAKDSMIATIGCDACFVRSQALDEQNFTNVREARRDIGTRARAAVKAAVQAGALVRPRACTACSRECVTSGHHDSYARPLDVIWLCNGCHGKRHGELAANGVDTYEGTAGACRPTPRPLTVPAGYRAQAAWAAAKWLRERSAA